MRRSASGRTTESSRGSSPTARSRRRHRHRGSRLLRRLRRPPHRGHRRHPGEGRGLVRQRVGLFDAASWELSGETDARAGARGAPLSRCNRHIVVGYDGTEEARDALALAEVLRSRDGIVTAGCVPVDLSGTGVKRTLEPLEQEAGTRPWLRTMSLADYAGPEGLGRLVHNVLPDLFVLGSVPKRASPEGRLPGLWDDGSCSAAPARWRWRRGGSATTPARRAR